MCTACRSLDVSKIDALGSRLLTVLNNASLALMISLGHRSGLLDTMAKLAPGTSHEVARAAGLNERYVREWLGCMLAAGLVEHDVAAGTWHLPAEHAALLTRPAAPNNFAAFMQYVSVLGSVEDKILHCFREGGGVPYSDFSRFHEVMAEDSGQTVVAGLFEHIVPLVPGLHEKLSAGIDVLDLGCGRGIALGMLAARYPKSRFVGVDLSPEAVAWATAQAARAGLANVRYEAQDACDAQLHPRVRLCDDVRRHSRPGASRSRVAQHRAGAASRRHVPHAGHPCLVAAA